MEMQNTSNVPSGGSNPSTDSKGINKRGTP